MASSVEGRAQTACLPSCHTMGTNRASIRSHGEVLLPHFYRICWTLWCVTRMDPRMLQSDDLRFAAIVGGSFARCPLKSSAMATWGFGGTRTTAICCSSLLWPSEELDQANLPVEPSHIASGAGTDCGLSTGKTISAGAPSDLQACGERTSTARDATCLPGTPDLAMSLRSPLPCRVYVRSMATSVLPCDRCASAAAPSGVTSTPRLPATSGAIWLLMDTGCEERPVPVACKSTLNPRTMRWTPGSKLAVQMMAHPESPVVHAGVCAQKVAPLLVMDTPCGICNDTIRCIFTLALFPLSVSELLGGLIWSRLSSALSLSNPPPRMGDRSPLQRAPSVVDSVRYLTRRSVVLQMLIAAVWTVMGCVVAVDGVCERLRLWRRVCSVCCRAPSPIFIRNPFFHGGVIFGPTCLVSGAVGVCLAVLW